MMTREQTKEVFGEPDQVSTTTRKYKIPFIFKYGDLEITFGPHKDSKILWVKYKEKFFKINEKQD